MSKSDQKERIEEFIKFISEKGYVLADETKRIDLKPLFRKEHSKTYSHKDGLPFLVKIDLIYDEVTLLQIQNNGNAIPLLSPSKIMFHKNNFPTLKALFSEHHAQLIKQVQEMQKAMQKAPMKPM